MSFVTSEEVVNSSSPYQKFEFQEVGDSVTIYMVGTGTRASEQYGEFQVVEGIAWNRSATTLEELRESLKPISFVCNKVLSGHITNNTLRAGGVYSIELVLKKDMKYTAKNGSQQKAKANHFEIKTLGLSKDALDVIKEAVPNQLNVSEEPTVEAPNVARPRL